MLRFDAVSTHCAAMMGGQPNLAPGQKIVNEAFLDDGDLSVSHIYESLHRAPDEPDKDLDETVWETDSVPNVIEGRTVAPEPAPVYENAVRAKNLPMVVAAR